ncbi:MAG: hypothetical protein K9M02_10795 [Thiohalocapsa sp.]|nr:hypothetical protein [Thiohalocapsa sp.]
MPERGTATPKSQVTGGAAGHPDNGWAAPSRPRAADDARNPGPPPESEVAVAALANWFALERLQLRAAADTSEIAVMERLRTERRRQGVGPGAARLGLRIREPRRPGGSFTIEWFRVQRRGRTQYIARGTGDAYPRYAFAGALPWERGIAVEAEQTLGAIRRRLRLMKDIERRVADFRASAPQLPDIEKRPDQSRAAAGGESA